MNQQPNDGEAAGASSFADLQRSIHDPRYWELDEADAQAMFASYTQLQLDDLRLEYAFGLALLVAQELSRLRLVAKALALERAPAAPVVPPRPQGRPRQPQRLTVRANPERATVTVFGARLSAARARELGRRLVQAAGEIDGDVSE